MYITFAVDFFLVKCEQFITYTIKVTFSFMNTRFNILYIKIYIKKKLIYTYIIQSDAKNKNKCSDWCKVDFWMFQN